ncbi:neuronal tyrosine-phosphorylated phosphoinositide-3-kinase adapter 1 [Sardina pilchardus]|uniref:neuronal tyrosine-phosphorylated phosphoinositide-3-kinase adapter 1 n=1 Tax=Sardina pilchardus TaxID=27697 RepID=UPI002E1171DB
MNLLYRKSRLDWRNRDQESSKKSWWQVKSSSHKDTSSATVGKVRDLASFRRHFRMGFMTMPASQDLSPHSCASAMAPRSQSCHAVGAGEPAGDLENGDYAGSDDGTHQGNRCPPAKPKRHPSTRLSSTPQGEHPPRGGIAGIMGAGGHAPSEAPPPSSSTLSSGQSGQGHHSSSKHGEKKNAMKKSDSGEMANKKVPPLKPKRSPSTQLSFDPPLPRLPPPATPLPFQNATESSSSLSGASPGEGGLDDEPVYIEMVGQVFTRESATATPHPPLTPSATTPDSDSDPGEAIYEEMKYPLPDEHSPKAAVSMSHSSPLPCASSSASSTPVPLSSSPHAPRAPTPFLLQGGSGKPELDSSSSTSSSATKIPAPFPNLLQHKPPLLAFPQPAAASSGVAESSGGGSGGAQDKQQAERREAQLGPAPGLRARSHSTPLPPSSKSSSPYSHHHQPHHHPHHRPSHYHHYRKPDKESGKSCSSATSSSSQIMAQTQGKEGKSRPHSRPHLHRSHTPHALSHGLPAYKPPPADSPLLWTYPSVGFRRPPAYDSLRGGSQLHSLHHDPGSKGGGGGGGGGSGPSSLPGKAGFVPWDGNAGMGLPDDMPYWPMHRKLSFSHSRDTEKEDGSVWNGGSDGLLRKGRDDLALGLRGGHSGIPVRTSGRPFGHSESLAGADGPPGFRALSRGGLPLPCQTFPACRNGELARLGRSSSTSGVRQVGGGDVQRQSSLPAKDVLSQLQAHALAQAQAQAPCSPSLSRQQQQLHLHQQFQHLAQLAQGQALATGGAAITTTATSGGGSANPAAIVSGTVAAAAAAAAASAGGGSQAQRDGKLLEVIERKRCLCKEIKAHRRPDKSLCKQDSMPILPSWRRTPEPRKTGTPPCQRPQAVVWDTAI